MLAINFFAFFVHRSINISRKSYERPQSLYKDIKEYLLTIVLSLVFFLFSWNKSQKESKLWSEADLKQIVIKGPFRYPIFIAALVRFNITSLLFSKIFWIFSLLQFRIFWFFFLNFIIKKNLILDKLRMIKALEST